MKILKRLLFSFGILLGGIGLSLVLNLVLLPPIAPGYADALSTPHPQLNLPAISNTGNILFNDVLPLAISPPSLITPANGATVTDPRPAFNWSDVSGAVSYTLRITGEQSFVLSAQSTTVETTTFTSSYMPSQNLPNGVYTWTVQAHDGAGQAGGYAAPYTFTLQASWQIFLPVVYMSPTCPDTSSAHFDVIPIEGGGATDHPPPLHADLNLSLRGYSVTDAPKELQGSLGEPDAPQLIGLFSSTQFPGISAVYRVNDWNWGCGLPHGCPGGPITSWPVTMLGLPATPGQAIYIPERGPEIYGGGYIAMVLYAEERRITLGYTRRDSVVPGYTAHLENICVDPNLLALYRNQVDADGWHVTGNLPALTNNQALGTAFSDQIRVVIRDKGSFMDPRYRDWWRGY